MFKTLGEVIRGERSLAETYWLWFVLPQIPITLTLLITTAFGASIAAYNPQLLRMLTYGALIVGFVVLLFSGFAIYQSAFKSAKTRVWAAIAMVIVAVNIVVAGVRVPGALLGTAQLSDEAMELMVTMLNARLPRQLDEVTTLVRIGYKSKVLTYFHTLDASVAGRIEGSSMRAIARPNICKAFVTSFAQGHLEKVVYAYASGSEDLFQFEVHRTDCGS